MNLSTVRADLKARLGGITGLTAYDVVPAKPEVPCAVVQVERVEAHSTFERGSCLVHLTVQVLVQLAEWGSAQKALDGYASIGTGVSSSVVDALEQGTGGTEDVTVDSIEDYGTVPVGEVTYGTVLFRAVAVMSS